MTDLRQTFATTEDVILAPGRLLLDDGPRPGMAVLLRGGRFDEIAPPPPCRPAIRARGWSSCRGT
ncbi:hypothetical protein PE067_06420 [Paracoccus sp. DMF-8]|uniref:hypothetical protein n=1 Tax=Paracoccus sp. DMF-8 TaxID=3019445 RepID=UPI0023E7D235|nr:hypothetical protein [Paracoccus sp. DMF-8]MDF3605811.1 hypothetical protein [Paracoccus sp. DMF-8]